jgi:hypothetical protein
MAKCLNKHMALSLIIYVSVLLWLLVLTFFIFKLLRHPKSVPHKISTPGFHLGLVKFNPFSDTGGDQSFVISLLDGGGSGILITSLHGRGATRLYVKKVTEGKTDQSLSLEEQQALKQAQEL